MMKILLILLLAAPVWASGPKNNFKDARLNDEFDNVYHDIGSATSRPSLLKPPKRTLAQLQATTFLDSGEQYTCTTCTTDQVCQSSAAARGAIARLTSKSTACQ